MKMTKKVLLLVIVVSLIAGGSVSAMIDVIQSRIENKAEAVSGKVQDNYEEYQEEKRHMILTTVDQMTNEQLERMEKEVMDYYWQHQYQDLNQEMEKESQEIIKLTDKKIEELKQQIRELFPDVKIPKSEGGAKG